jgi:hypothetical protein
VSQICTFSCLVFLKAAAARRVESKEKRLVHRKNNMPEAYVYTSESFWTHSTPQCDQLQPSCSRCARLFIPCSGGGVQRYVFLDNSGPGGKAQQFKEFLSRRDALINAPTQAVGSIPPNSQDSMTALMVNKFSITDLRYDVSWAFGPFIHEIPRRVEHSVALDFAARTFVLSLGQMSWRTFPLHSKKLGSP